MEIACPKCGSHDLHAGKKGFSGKKAVAGAVLTGGVGLLAGTIGSNKIRITCLKCGNVFSPGESQRPEVTESYLPSKELSSGEKKAARIGFIIVGALLLLVAAICLITAFAGETGAIGGTIICAIFGFVMIRLSTKYKRPVD